MTGGTLFEIRLRQGCSSDYDTTRKTGKKRKRRGVSSGSGGAGINGNESGGGKMHRGMESLWKRGNRAAQVCAVQKMHAPVLGGNPETPLVWPARRGLSAASLMQRTDMTRWRLVVLSWAQSSLRRGFWTYVYHLWGKARWKKDCAVWHLQTETPCPAVRLRVRRWRRDCGYFAQNNELAFPNVLASMMKLA